MRILYFAWVRAKVGVTEEKVELPADVKDVNGLLAWLRGRGPGFADALADPSVIRVAVNQHLVPPNHPLAQDDEVAVFPPVTGG